MAWTCVPAHDVPRNGTKSLALCGNYVRKRDFAAAGEAPSCPDCKAELDRLNEDRRDAVDVFGTDEDIRANGPTVAARHFDPLSGYRPSKR